jgi:cell division protein FtsL
MLDRLVRGRAWIPVLGIMLAGIVFLQVAELKLGAAYGRAVQQTEQLSAENQALLASTGALGDTSRIESIAGRMGYIMPAPAQTGFLDGSGDHLVAALANLRPADPNMYLNAPSTLNGGIAGTAVTSQVSSVSTSATSTPSGGATSTAGAAPQNGSGAATGGAATSGGAGTTSTPTTTPTSTPTSAGATTTSAGAATTSTGAPTTSGGGQTTTATPTTTGGAGVTGGAASGG